MSRDESLELELELELELGAWSGPMTTIPEPSPKPLAPPKPTQADMFLLPLSQRETWMKRAVRRFNGCKEVKVQTWAGFSGKSKPEVGGSMRVRR